MARSDLLRKLFDSYARADDVAFRRVASEVIADERHKNHRLLANELEQALGTQRPPGGGDPLTLRPIPKNRDERPLLRLDKPRRELPELVLNSSLRSVIEEIIVENQARSLLTSHALHPRQRLLFLGPPGTGKSATAHAIAAELSLPVATASLASLTSSFLGDTARNIESVIRFAEQTPCVLLLDEFDVLGQDRGQVGDHGEMRRVAATVLQLLEDVHGESLIVATSNHPRTVDTAVWRRFDEVVGFDPLDQAQIADLIELKLRAVHHDLSTRLWAKRMAGFSPAEVEIVCVGAMRRALIAERTTVNDYDMGEAASAMRRRRNLMAHSGPETDDQ
ncbi:ATPase central domain-containing protein [Mycobacteroides abscessus]|uniref:AAA family ATPase n=1 Tax=Mycobacteroides abscessus TaxID=36809 RepID=UPI0003097BDB|nr:ATP-binding protein [Mycobacteroides abscessus]CPT82260.1 ATPase central domain-containing protein [Mycobacteroides abscessus]CPU63458.1 ATPase central domain-containing protein [Mycobacteroides abscessus]SKG53695.1 ATPase central domain-containing protein [Mycobacteroides abscessus subsp. massiliense]SKH48396.1 ATPase central domain-containing protein [Mycobacteroides abscessus subsp. massiliense]SKH97097.1 ATPase central domain-containing protein [Mycobacteroides abscessus subsp. massilie